MPEDQSAGPDGIAIGRALVVPPGLIHDDLREVVRVINRIHGTGHLPQIPLRMARLPLVPRGGRVRHGRFVFDPATGRPIAILIEVDSPHRMFAALHEIGHLLDVSGIGQSGQFASVGSEELIDWRRAVVRTRAIAELTELSQRDWSDREFATALLDPVEAWARSYAQYVVNRCASATLRGSLDAIRTPVPSRVHYPQQWADDDFVLVDDAIEALIRRFGWRTNPSIPTSRPRSPR